MGKLSGLSGRSFGAELAALGGIESSLWNVAMVASSAASAYHGYKRNDSIGWAIWWSFAGYWFFPITPAVALAQGFGERKR